MHRTHFKKGFRTNFGNKILSTAFPYFVPTLDFTKPEFFFSLKKEKNEEKNFEKFETSYNFSNCILLRISIFVTNIRVNVTDR